MTVVVGFYCKDGVVIASDSMITPSLGTLAVGHHKGKKIYLISRNQIFSFSGDFGLAARFLTIADNKSDEVAKCTPLNYCLRLSQDAVVQFQSTGLELSNIDLGIVLAFPSGDGFQCCVFENMVQPRLLDKHHHYIALGVGKMSADPFLRFLDEIFIKEWDSLTVKEACFLAVWTVEHVIETNPGGIAAPIQMAILSAGEDGMIAREFSESEILETLGSIESAENALRSWRDGLSGAAAPVGTMTPTPPHVPIP